MVKRVLSPIVGTNKHLWFFQLILFWFLLTNCVACSAQKPPLDDSSFISQSVQGILDDLCKQSSERDSIINLNKRLKKQSESLIQKKDSLLDSKLLVIYQKISANDSVYSKLNAESIKLRESLKMKLTSINGAYQLSFKGVAYQIYVHNDTISRLRLHHKNSKAMRYRSISHLKKELTDKGDHALMITNAGMYTPTNDPEGLFIENYKEKFPVDLDSSTILLNFYMHPNGVFYLNEKNEPYILSTSEFLELRSDSTYNIKFATQSGPMLKINGVVHPNFNWGSTSRKIRSGVGIYEGISVFAITRGLSNFYDFASFYTEIFECENALFLDGAISRMYDPILSPNDVGGDFGPMISISSLREQPSIIK